MNKFIISAIFSLLTISCSYAQLSHNYLIGKWVCYKTTMADGNINDAFGMPFTPRNDTLEFLEDGALKVYDKQEETSEYRFDNGYLILGNRKYLLNILGLDMFYIETKSKTNLPASWEFRYYYCRIGKEYLLNEEKISTNVEPINLDNYLFGKWVKYKEGNSSGDSIQSDGTQFTLTVDTLEFVPPNQVIIKEKFKPTVEATFLKVMTLIGWNKDSHSFGIIDIDHFFLDDFNPNYPEPVVRRHYYKRIE